MKTYYKLPELTKDTIPNDFYIKGINLYYFETKYDSLNSNKSKIEWEYGHNDSKFPMLAYQKTHGITFCIITNEIPQKFPCPKKFPHGY